jgi:hypothetical protein
MISMEKGMYLWEFHPECSPKAYIVDSFVAGDMNLAGRIWAKCYECHNLHTSNKLFDITTARRSEICISDDKEIFKVIELF